MSRSADRAGYFHDKRNKTITVRIENSVQFCPSLSGDDIKISIIVGLLNYTES